MKLIYLLVTSAALFCLQSAAFANAKTVTAPFYNIPLATMEKLNVNYAFDPAKHVIVCKRDMTMQPVIFYPHGSVYVQNYLPITLKAKGAGDNFPGHLANASGTLKIESSSWSTQNISCYYVTVL